VRKVNDFLFAHCHDCGAEVRIEETPKEPELLTPEQFLARTQEMYAVYGTDKEAWHTVTDELMQDTLKALGYDISVIENSDRWYA
jgi:hypothetical protein